MVAANKVASRAVAISIAVAHMVVSGVATMVSSGAVGSRAVRVLTHLGAKVEMVDTVVDTVEDAVNG